MPLAHSRVTQFTHQGAEDGPLFHHILWWKHSLKLTVKAPTNDGFQFRNLLFQGSIFRGFFLVSGRVANCGVFCFFLDVFIWSTCEGFPREKMGKNWKKLIKPHFLKDGGCGCTCSFSRRLMFLGMWISQRWLEGLRKARLEASWRSSKKAGFDDVLGGPNWDVIAFSQQMTRVVFLNYPRCTIKITGYLWWINKYFAKSSCSCSSHANFMIFRSCLPAMDHGFSRLQNQTPPIPNSRGSRPWGAPEPLWRHHTCGQPSPPSTFWIMSWSHPVLIADGRWWRSSADREWGWPYLPDVYTLLSYGRIISRGSPGSGKGNTVNFRAKSRSYFVSWNESERIQTPKKTQESQQKTFKDCLPFVSADSKVGKQKKQEYVFY